MKYKELLNSTRKISPTSIQEAGTRKTFDLDLSYDEQHQIMTFTGKIAGSRGAYDWQLDFMNVDKEENLSTLEIREQRFPKPSLSRHDIKVFCSCDSFRFTFSEPNRLRNAKTGPSFPGFVRKTDRASRNPNQQPGLCKHLITVVEELVNEGFIFT